MRRLHKIFPPRAPLTNRPHPAAISDLEEELPSYLLQTGRLRLQSNPRPRADERDDDGKPAARERGASVTVLQAGAYRVPLLLN